MRMLSGFSGGGSFLFPTAVTAFAGATSSTFFTSSFTISAGPEDAGPFVDVGIMLKLGCPFVRYGYDIGLALLELQY